MKKFVKRVAICGLAAAVCWSVFLITDREKLNRGLIRFHVVAHSDSDADQSIKRSVRDAVLQSIQEDLRQVGDIAAAREYLQENLPRIRLVAEQTLEALGFDGDARVSLCRESFGIRHYDTFSLPGGVYESLRIVIGDGLGENWWCVSFPTLCLPASASGFRDAAVSAGFSDSLVETLSGNESYEIRFFLLDQLGRMEKIFFKE